MNTTLNKIIMRNPCEDEWNILLKLLGKTRADDELISFKYILEYRGIENAIWYLRTLEDKEILLFCADVAELALPVFEKKYPNDGRPRKAIEGIRLYHSDDVDLKTLLELSRAADEAAINVDDNAAAYAANAIYSAAYADVNKTVYAAVYTVIDDATVPNDAVLTQTVRKEQWGKIEKLFIKHFCKDLSGKS